MQNSVTQQNRKDLILVSGKYLLNIFLLKSNPLDSLNKDIIVPNKTPCDDVPQDIWTRILAVVDSNEDEVVELDCTNIDKEKRSNIHSIVKRILQKNIIASTITRDNKKYIIFKKYKKQGKIFIVPIIYLETITKIFLHLPNHKHET